MLHVKTHQDNNCQSLNHTIKAYTMQQKQNDESIRYLQYQPVVHNTLCPAAVVLWMNIKQ